MSEPPVSRIVGVTGHQTLSSSTRQAVGRSIRGRLVGSRDLVGVTSLAAGADQLFAEIVCELGGRLVVVRPAKNYQDSFTRDEDLQNFDRLFSAASEVVEMPFVDPGEVAYWAAGKEMVDRSSEVFAIWDGRPAGGLGGTADVVEYARAQKKEVWILWPPGSSRV